MADELKDLTPGSLSFVEDNPAGFAIFYRLITGLELPPHAPRWVEAIYHGHETQKGVIIQAFRGSAKSTVLSVFAAWFLGHHPHLSVMVIRSSLNSAQDAGMRIATIIRDNPAWTLFFEHIRPDDSREGRGWSLNGYEIIDTSISRGEWTQRVARRGSPSLMAFPYNSKSIIGNRADLLIIDDIHDETNTASPSELATCKRLLYGTILPVLTQNAWCPLLIIGTPWLIDDALAELSASGEFAELKTYAVAPDGTATWPEQASLEFLDNKRKVIGAAEYARMYLLDPGASTEKVLTFHAYGHAAINSNWLTRGGLDYASIEGGGNLKWRSHFGLAYLSYDLSSNKWILVGGILRQISQAEGEQSIVRAQGLFPSWEYTVAEADGKGAEFIAILQRNPGLRILPAKTGGKSKEQRIINELGPFLETGRVLISDKEGDPFLAAVRRFSNSWPNINPRDAAWDAMDALYWSVFPLMFGGMSPLRPKKPQPPNPYFQLAQGKWG